MVRSDSGPRILCIDLAYPMPIKPKWLPLLCPREASFPYLPDRQKTDFLWLVYASGRRSRRDGLRDLQEVKPLRTDEREERRLVCTVITDRTDTLSRSKRISHIILCLRTWYVAGCSIRTSCRCTYYCGRYCPFSTGACGCNRLERRAWRDEWHVIVFSDESRFRLQHRNDSPRVWRHRGAPLAVSCDTASLGLYINMTMRDRMWHISSDASWMISMPQCFLGLRIRRISRPTPDICDYNGQTLGTSRSSTNSGQMMSARCLMPEAADGNVDWQLAVCRQCQKYTVQLTARYKMHSGPTYTKSTSRNRAGRRLPTNSGQIAGPQSYAGSGPIDGGKASGLRRLDDGKTPGLRWLDCGKTPGMWRLDSGNMPGLRRLDGGNMPGLRRLNGGKSWTSDCWVSLRCQACSGMMSRHRHVSWTPAVTRPELAICSSYVKAIILGHVCLAISHRDQIARPPSCPREVCLGNAISRAGKSAACSPCCQDAVQVLRTQCKCKLSRLLSSISRHLGLSRVVDFFSNVLAVVAAAIIRERYLPVKLSIPIEIVVQISVVIPELANSIADIVPKPAISDVSRQASLWDAPATLGTVRLEYGSTIWHKRPGLAHIWRKLLSVQRAALLAVTKVYHSTSMDALQVLAGIAPMELCVAKLGEFALENVTGTVDPDSRKVDWEKLNSGRPLTRGELPMLSFPVWERLHLNIYPSHTMMQFLSGHGDFKDKLHDLGIVESQFCNDFLVPHTMGHVLNDCVCFIGLCEQIRWNLSLIGLDFGLAAIKAANSTVRALLSAFASKIISWLDAVDRMRAARLSIVTLQPN
ncbi:hypothetical protein PR048_014587 [Dryococelus australis]|uniref:Uncharacterized protein n=1 Tax=Dryococelus australis TaxID=614101 RepID=A0ABQ9HFF5_9NEOP|nr:hypothetical protein PR048_014587 [Dryococelus australis]